ncbi:hypothetical protein BOO34_00725 [Vibrio navarrensis]|nr:hypothetical protein [Vibrio navarrensis]
MSNSRELYVSRYLTHLHQAKVNYKIECLGDHLAELCPELQPLTGREAVNLYLVQKYHWSLSDASAISYESLQVILANELQDFSLPQEARFEFAIPDPKDFL